MGCKSKALHLNHWLFLQKTVKLTLKFFFFQAKEGHHYETSERYEAMLTAFKQDCRHFCYHEMSGKHHIHLTHANTVGAYILSFLEECKKEHQNYPPNSVI